MTQPAIIARNLTFVYRSGTGVKFGLQNINLEIQTGSFVAIAGGTGSGKSTLVQHFNGLLRPTSGQLIVKGRDLSLKDPNLKELRREVGMLFQFPEAQLFERTVYEDVAFGPRNLELDPLEIRNRVAGALNLVGLPLADFGGRSPFELSGGQMRRVALAGVLVLEPSILVLDEPGAGLDVQAREELYTFLKRIQKIRGTTIILVSHDMAEIAELAEYLFVLRSGKLVMEGSPAAVFSRGEELRNQGLAEPPLVELLNVLRRKGIPLEPAIQSVEAAVSELARLRREGIF